MTMREEFEAIVTNELGDCAAAIRGGEQCMK